MSRDALEPVLIEALGAGAQSQVFLDGICEHAYALAWALNRVIREYGRAVQRYGVFGNAHEGLGVLLEEWTELVEAVRSNDPTRMLKEAEQVAAMAVRFLVDVGARES